MNYDSCSCNVSLSVSVSIQILLHNRMTNVNARQNDGATALTLVARLAIEGMMQELITADADVNAADTYGKSHDNVRLTKLPKFCATSQVT